MIRFISRAILVAAFFIGLGGIVDTTARNIFSAADDLVREVPECPQPQIRKIRIDDARPANVDYHFRLILPNIDEAAKAEFKKIDGPRRVVVIKQGPNI